MTLEEMEKRLRNLEDINAIVSMHNEYLFYLNNCQWEKMADCFAENATANIHELRKGRAEIFKLFTGVISKLNTGKDRDAHFAVQPTITVDGDKAKGHWLMYIFISDPVTGNVSRLLPGSYDVEYVREKGKWKFGSLVYTSPWPVIPDTQPV